MITTTDTDTHPFIRETGAAAWICQCGRSRNSAAHKGTTPRTPRAAKATHRAGTVSAAHVEPGTIVITTDVVGTDFGLPLVEPTRRAGGFTRTVRSHLRESGGTVVRFTDGSKTRPLNGQTVFILAEGEAHGKIG
jgi:CDGSH-type Zn-finger protein